MKNIKMYKNISLQNTEMHNIFGGQDIKTTIGGTKDKPQYSDVHHDNDNDGRWSPGDTFDLTRNYIASEL